MISIRNLQLSELSEICGTCWKVAT